MRTSTTAAAAALLACASLATAVGQTTIGDAAANATTTTKKTVATKACTSAADALVWFVPGSKLFFRKGQAGFGKGVGSLVCRHVALGKHAHAAPTQAPTAGPAEPSAMPTSMPRADSDRNACRDAHAHADVHPGLEPRAGRQRRADDAPLAGAFVPAVPPAPPAISTPSPSPAPAASAAPLAGPWIAAPRPWNKAAWLAQHDGYVARARQGGIDVLFLGDSITEYFTTRGKDVWDRAIAPLGSVADFGISGDRTQFVLWRAQNGELDGTNARVVVLMIGTNNLASATPESIARGVACDRRHRAREIAERGRRAERAAAARRARRSAARKSGRRERADRTARRRHARALARRRPRFHRCSTARSPAR